MMPDDCYLDIATLGRRYRDRTLSPVEATKVALDRIRMYDRQLNAFITVLEAAAMAQAQAAEAAFASGGEYGPLFGVPISLKDIIDTAGIRTTAASRIWRDHVPTQTATVAQRLADAGAILLGRCNMLEFAYGIVHPDYGQCNNPWDIDRTSGGSSSGSAASVAAGMGWASIGTDTGGSIRIPASYCGIAGLKPTYGLVSVHGIFPLSHSLDHAGPLTRTVEDAALVLQTIAGHDPRDSTSLIATPPDYRAALTGDIRGLQLGVLTQHMGAELRPGVGAAVEAAIGELERAGMRVQRVSIPLLEQADSALIDAIMPEATLVHQAWLRERPDEYAAQTRVQLEQGQQISVVAYLQAQDYRSGLRQALIAALHDVDVLISPTVPWEAPAEDPAVGGNDGAAESRFTGPYNLTGLPAISLPCGFGPHGLPLCMQLIGPPLGEALLLQVAHAYEQRAGWVVRHPAL